MKSRSSTMTGQSKESVRARREKAEPLIDDYIGRKDITVSNNDVGGLMVKEGTIYKRRRTRSEIGKAGMD